jgi:hypothetical protein
MPSRSESSSSAGLPRDDSGDDSVFDLELLRSIIGNSTPVASVPPSISGTRPRTVQSPPRTPAVMSYGSDGALSELDDNGVNGGFELPSQLITGSSWSVDPNYNVPENFTLAGVDLTSARLPDRMKDLMDDYAYWLSVVDRLGFDQSNIFQFTEVPSLDLLSRFFDSSHLGLLRVFHIFDKDKDALITREEIADGLEQQGFYTKRGSQSADMAFDEFCELLTRRTFSTSSVSSSANQLVSPPEFLLSLRCLRLAAVVHGYMYPTHQEGNEDESEIVLHYHQYREDRIWSHLPLEGPISFLFRTADEEQMSTCRVHWIHSHEPSIRAVLALGVKYGLDPRFTLDILSLWKQQALVDRSLSYVARTRGDASVFDKTSVEEQPFLDREWIFAIIPLLRLSDLSESTMNPFNEWRLESLRYRSHEEHVKPGPPPPVLVEVDTCNLGVFVSGQALGGTIISFSTEWTCGGSVETSNAIGDDDLDIFEGCVEDSNINNDFKAFSRIMTQLRTAYSHLRTGDAHTLFLKELCDITDDYVKVVGAYEAALVVLGKRLDAKRDGLEHFEVQRIQACVRQITMMIRMVRPVATVVDILDAREWGGDAELYLSDVKANVLKFLDNASAVRDTARLLGNQFKNYCDTKTRRVLFTLTLVTTIFTPLIWLTSLEGMNFPNMPEIQAEYGYVYFWVVCIVITACLLIYYRRRRWI